MKYIFLKSRLLNFKREKVFNLKQESVTHLYSVSEKLFYLLNMKDMSKSMVVQIVCLNK